LSRATALLRATSVRFTALYFLPYYAALSAAGQARWEWVVLGVVYWFAHSMGTETLNRLADRTEDEVNRPERTALCHRAGFDLIRRAAVCSWAAVAALDVVFLVLRPDPWLALFLLLGGLASVNYSYGLRLSRNRVAAPIVLTFHFGGTFVIGWVLSREEWDTGALADFAEYPLPFFAVGFLTLLALGGAKDLTDLAGDAKIGYHSAWVGLVRRHGSLVTTGMVWSTYVMVALFTAVGVFPRRFWLWLLLLPVATALGRCLWRASSPAESMATREFFYQYWVLNLAVALPLYAPHRETAVAVVCGLAGWALATQRMHWSAGVRRETLRALAALLGLAPRGPEPEPDPIPTMEGKVR
jgi:4-hydroxybenzoate polyprenyltransferase